MGCSAMKKAIPYRQMEGFLFTAAALVFTVNESIREHVTLLFYASAVALCIT